MIDKKWFPWIVVAALLGSPGSAPAAPQTPQPLHVPKAQPTSLEYKLLLRPEAFQGVTFQDDKLQDKDQSVQRYLDKALGPGKLKFTKEPTQEIIEFFDTPGCDFSKNHLILRRRAGKKKNDVTLKCRTDSRLLADIGGYLTGNGTPATPELGEERVLEAPASGDASRAVASHYSMDTKLETQATIPQTLQGAAGLFPGLTTLAEALDLNAENTPIQSKSGGIVEVELSNKDLSSLGLGDDVAGEIDLTFWFRQGHPELLIAELSYKLKVLPPPSLRGKADVTFDAIREKSKEELSLETSKTAIAYGNSCADQAKN